MVRTWGIGPFGSRCPKGNFWEQSSGKRVEGIEGIPLNIPHHTAILTQEQPIFESLASFYRRHEALEADRKEVIEDSKSILQSNPGRLVNSWWGLDYIPDWLSKVWIAAPIVTALLLTWCCGSKICGLIARCL